MPEQDNLEPSQSDKLGPTLFVVASVCAVVSIWIMHGLFQVRERAAGMEALGAAYGRLFAAIILLLCGVTGFATAIAGMRIRSSWRLRFIALLTVNATGMVVALGLTRGFWWQFLR